MKLSEITNEEARSWLMINDKEAVDFWADCVGELISSVYDNLDSFGYASQLGDLTIEREGGHDD